MAAALNVVYNNADSCIYMHHARTRPLVGRLGRPMRIDLLEASQPNYGLGSCSFVCKIMHFRLPSFERLTVRYCTLVN